MALTFPLLASEFQQKLKISEVSFWPQDFTESSMTAGGDLLVSQIAWPKWRADVSLSPRYHTDMRETKGLLHAIGPYEKFRLYDTSRKRPRMDPTGALLAGYSPIIHSVGSDNKSIRITGFPSGYVLSVGDLFAVDYGSSPTRHALHEIVEAATASGGAGLTAFFEVRPHFRLGVQAGQAVDLILPRGHFQFIPGSINYGSAGRRVTSGMSFSAIEVR